MKTINYTNVRVWSSYGLFIWLGLALLSGCVQFKEAQLYSGTEAEIVPEPPARINMVVEPLIFSNSAKDMWGLEKNNCQEASLISEPVHSGDKAIKLNWNRGASGCTWAGIGIGWDSYAGKDLSEIMNHAAIQMHVRAQKGKMFGLPFVLTLEDYSGGMGFCYAANKYFERTAIDENWQKVIVPLRDFDIKIENLDVSNIKQLMIEFQQSGAVYVDDIELILFTPESVTPWMYEEKLPNPTALPIVLFNDTFINNHGFGLIKDKCRDIEIVNEGNSNKVIHARWNASASNCHALSFGLSWNKWFPVDILTIANEAVFQFELNLQSDSFINNGSLQVGIEDYNRKKSFVTIQKNQASSANALNKWTKIQIPVSSLSGDADLTRVKLLFFSMDGIGDVMIDKIEIRSKN